MEAVISITIYMDLLLNTLNKTIAISGIAKTNSAKAIGFSRAATLAGN